MSAPPTPSPPKYKKLPVDGESNPASSTQCKTMQDRAESPGDDPVGVRPVLFLSKSGLRAFCYRTTGYESVALSPSKIRILAKTAVACGGFSRSVRSSRPRFRAPPSVRVLHPSRQEKCVLARRLPDYLRPSGRPFPRSAPLSGTLCAVRCALVKNRFERFRTKGTKTCHFKHRINRKSLPLSRLSPPPLTGCSTPSGREEAKPWPTISASWADSIGTPLTTFC